MVEEDKLEELIRKHVLLNAIAHKGKADSKAVLSKVIAENVELRSRIKGLLTLVEHIVKEVNSMSLEEQRSIIQVNYPEALEKEEKEERVKVLPDLPKAEKGKVITRFPPEPSGYLHIGHAKAAIIDEEYAKMYNGKFILRFDDTNPEKAKLEFYEAIKEDLNWLGVKPQIIENTSDDIEKLYDYARKLIEKGLAYVCICKPETIKSNRIKGIECNCRASKVEDNLEKWEKMFKVFSKNEAILRFKGDMKSLNTAMRDPTLFRILDIPHPLKGYKYRVWPTYDFATPIKDSLDGVTHALRTKEYELRDELYFSILRALGLREPILLEFSRLEMKGSILSKRKIRELIQQGIIESWDDPRLATLRALRRRGYFPEAIREFILSIGVSKVESEPTWDLINSINRRIIDAKAKRLFFVSNPIKVKLESFPKERISVNYHPDRDLGKREIKITQNLFFEIEDLEKFNLDDKFRLMGLGNVRLIQKEDLPIVKFEGFELDHRLKKIHWVNEDSLPFEVFVPLNLVQDGEINRDSLKVIRGKVEDSIKKLNVGEIVQFVRFGFCRIEANNKAIFAHK
ncbi:MAG: glutamate--tRNA ligase [Nitrososphaerales archaeon]